MLVYSEQFLHHIRGKQTRFTVLGLSKLPDGLAGEVDLTGEPLQAHLMYAGVNGGCGLQK